MPLSNVDQMNLLKDILNNHQADCCGSVSECEQIQRLVKSLMVQSNTNNELNNLLQDIYHYSQQGVQSKNLDEHIETNQNQLSEWVSNIDSLS